MKKEKQDEHKQHVRELENAKSALLNLLEDSEETNKKLKDTQKELQKTIEELKRLDKQKDEFISIAAHELKTPLTSLIGFSTLLEKDVVTNDKEKLKKYLRIIKEDSVRLTKLVTDILDLSKIDLGTLKIYPKKINLSRLLNEIKELFEERLKEKKLYFAIKCKKNITIYADKERMAQVLNNLVTNATNYTEKGGITIIVENNKHTVIRIKDTGVGISEEGLKNIFKRFYQVDSTLTRKIGGSGLGLAISRGLVEAMGGTIEIFSKVGAGTEFQIKIPKKPKSMESVSLIKKEEHKASKKIILHGE